MQPPDYSTAHKVDKSMTVYVDTGGDRALAVSTFGRHKVVACHGLAVV